MTAKNITICREGASNISSGTLNTPDFPAWFSANHCRCNIVTHKSCDLVFSIDFEYMINSVLQDSSCAAYVTVQSDVTTPFSICPTSLHSTKLTLSLQANISYTLKVVNPLSDQESYTRFTVKFRGMSLNFWHFTLIFI